MGEDAEKLAEIFDELEDQLSELFDREKIEPAGQRYDRFVHMKYRLQQGSLAVPITKQQAAGGALQDLRADFEARYTEIYGANAAFRNSEVEIVKMHIEGTSDTVVPSLAPVAIDERGDAGAAFKYNRPIYFIETSSFISTPIYDGRLLRPGMKISGPSIVERMGDSIVLPAFTKAVVDEYENVIITLISSRAEE